jgi:hypothetical protein
MQRHSSGNTRGRDQSRRQGLLEDMNTIAVIGMGRLGLRLSEEIIRAGLCQRLLLRNRSQRKLDGAILSLRIIAKLTNRQTSIDVLKKKDLAHADIIVIAVKDEYDPRDLLADEKYPAWFPKDVRTIGLRRDLPLVRNVCNLLSGYSGQVLVLTNPVDVVATFVKEWLPEADVLGLGVSLDAARLCYSLRELGVPVHSWRECPVAGEHGRDLIVLKSLWEENLRNSIDSAIIDRALQNSAKIGPDIVKGLGYTLHDCILVFFQDIQWLSEPHAGSDLMFGSLGNTEGSIGRPLVRSGDSGRLQAFEILADTEKTAIDQAREKVAELVVRIRQASEF